MNDNTRIEVLLLTEASDGEIAEMLRKAAPPPTLAATAGGGEVRSESSGGLAQHLRYLAVGRLGQE